VNLPELDPEQVVKFLTRTELGATMWRSAQAEAMVELLAQRIDQLESQKDAPANG
jgi:hypothetical protein